MTDNRTTELLDRLRNVGNLHELTELFGFNWYDESDWTWHDVAVKMAYELEQAIAATLGSGKLTAEQVREAIEVAKAFSKIEQAIAATLGSGTCEIETTKSWLPVEQYHRCKHCGAFFAVMNASGDIPPCVCPNCGKAVKR